MRRSTFFLALSLLQVMFLLAILMHARRRGSTRRTATQPCAEQVERWQLTDLCLFTEARYTRHPALADFHAPFQDHPGALEHFPSGSLLRPPKR